MWVAPELRLPGHPGPATESQDIWNDDPPRDSTATSILSHDRIIGSQSSSVQPLPRSRLPPIWMGVSAMRWTMSSFVRAMPDTMRPGTDTWTRTVHVRPAGACICVGPERAYVVQRPDLLCSRMHSVSSGPNRPWLPGSCLHLGLADLCWVWDILQRRSELGIRHRHAHSRAILEGEQEHCLADEPAVVDPDVGRNLGTDAHLSHLRQIGGEHRADALRSQVVGLLEIKRRRVVARQRAVDGLLAELPWCA
jgi:hypothetical protein